MKRIFLFSLFLLLFLTSGFAQRKIRLGFEGGPNYASFSGFSGASDFKPKISFTVGVTAEFKLKDRLYLKTGLSFERKRATNDTYYYIDFNPPFNEWIPISAYIQADYLVCPVMTKYEFGKNDPFYMTFGLFAAMTLKSEFFSDDNYSRSNVFKSTDIGLCFGVGKAFDFGLKNAINIELRENLGVVNTNKDYSITGGGKVNTNSFNLICGYSFDIK